MNVIRFVTVVVILAAILTVVAFVEHSKKKASSGPARVRREGLATQETGEYLRDRHSSGGKAESDKTPSATRGSLKLVDPPHKVDGETDL
jgi:hypothetical protein